jgi:hypothetical protein
MYMYLFHLVSLVGHLFSQVFVHFLLRVDLLDLVAEALHQAEDSHHHLGEGGSQLWGREGHGQREGLGDRCHF